MLEAVKKLLAARSAASEAIMTVDGLREVIAVRREELQRVKAAYVPPTEALVEIESWLDRTARSAIDDLRLRHLVEPGYARDGIKFQSSASAIDAIFGLFLATNRQAVLDLIERDLESFVSDRFTIPSGQRAAKIAEATAALLEAELAEEGAIRTLEAAGVSIARRADLDPRAALAADESLPA